MREVSGMDDLAVFRGGALGRWLPPQTRTVDEAVLLRRCWALLALDRAGAARLALLARGPLCRTVLLPQEGTALSLRTRQAVDYGLSPRCSLTLSGVSPRPVLCVQRSLITVSGGTIEPQELPLPRRWSRLPPEALLLTAGTWLLAEGRIPE